MRRRTSLALLLIVAVFEPAQVAASTSERVPLRFYEPLALAALSSGEVVVLERRGGLVLFDPEQAQAFTLRDRFPGELPVDISASDIDDSVLVTLSRSVAQGNARITTVSRISRDSEEVEAWQFVRRGLFAGIAADLANRRIYLTNSIAGEIAVLDQGSVAQRSPRFLCRVPRSRILGSLAIDRAARRLYVADPAKGAVHSVDLAGGHTEELAGSLGEPLALALDGDRRRLFVADAARGKIWVLSLQASPSPRIFAQPRALRRPQGIAVTKDGKVWVADSRTNRLFEFSVSGEQLRSFP